MILSSVILSKRAFWTIKGIMLFSSVALLFLLAYTYALKKTIDIQLVQAFEFGRKTFPAAKYEEDNQPYCWDGGNYFFVTYNGKNAYRIVMESKQ